MPRRTPPILPLALTCAAALLAGCEHDGATDADLRLVTTTSDPAPAPAPAPGSALHAGWFRGPTAAVHAGPIDETGRRPHDVGPPPPGHPRIVGDAVPDWRADRVFGPGADLFDDGNPLTWRPIGPRPIISEYWSGNDDASGRVVGIAPHPTDPATVFIAAASGGVWRTTDGGTIWVPLTDELPTTNSGAIAVDPSNPDVVYLGTGEYQTGSRGAGVFRSADGGDTWDVFAGSSIVGTKVSTLLVDPADAATVHVAGAGYHRTTDGGASWSNPLDGDISGLVLDPTNPQRLMAGRQNDGVYRSLDGGASWDRLGGGLPNDGVNRIVLSLAASDPDRVYVAIAQGGGMRGTYRTDDFGDTWTRLDNTPDFASPQAWYDMYIAVDPADADTVYAGGVSPIYAQAGIIRTTDGGRSWTEISAGTTPASDQTHPDHHVMAFGPGGVIWEGNDGGVWRSTDGGDTWTNRNGTLGITQQYTVGVSPFEGAFVLGGTQDNGSIERTDFGDRWPQLIGGDGGYLAYDHEDPLVKYTTYVYLSVQRWIDGSFANISGPWGSDPKEFIAPLAMDPGDADTLYGGTNRLWRTTNASGAANWDAISGTEIAGGGVLCAIAPAPRPESDVVYTGSTNGRVWRFDGVDWTDESAGLPSTRIADIAVSPADDDVVYVAIQRRNNARIYRSQTGGPFWQNITGDLPNGYQVTALAVDWRTEPPRLFAGTGAGVFASFDGGVTWIKDGLDLPNVNIGDLVVDTGRDTILAGTYGRGTWVADLPALPGTCPADLDDDGLVGIGDLLAVLSSWGTCPGCDADLDGDGLVSFADALELLAAWGPCP
jgi:photosystem II stability/assembly factor-like uncharacterized protein